MAIKLSHIIFLVLSISVEAFSLPAQTPPFQRLTSKFENGKVFHAKFTRKAVDSYTGNKSKRSGKLWVAKNGYKIISGKQEITVNGKISTVYDRKKNRVIISNYDPKDDDFAPSRFLDGVDSTYTITSQKKNGDHYIIKLQSKDPFSVFKKVTITVSNQSIPQKLKVVDWANNQIITTFSDGSFVSRKPGLFSLTYPDSVQLIDMRK